MYVVNAIDLLNRLTRVKVLDVIASLCQIGVSAVRLTDYVRGEKILANYPSIIIVDIDEDFHNLKKKCDRNLSMGGFKFNVYSNEEL